MSNKTPFDYHNVRVEVEVIVATVVGEQPTQAQVADAVKHAQARGQWIHVSPLHTVVNTVTE